MGPNPRDRHMLLQLLLLGVLSNTNFLCTFDIPIFHCVPQPPWYELWLGGMHCVLSSNDSATHINRVLLLYDLYQPNAVNSKYRFHSTVNISPGASGDKHAPRCPSDCWIHYGHDLLQVYAVVFLLYTSWLWGIKYRSWLVQASDLRRQSYYLGAWLGRFKHGPRSIHLLNNVHFIEWSDVLDYDSSVLS